MTRPWRPRTLAGQIALLVAIGLFVAQAINFGLLLRERRNFRLEQTTGPVVARLIDAIERSARPRPDRDREQRGRVRRYAVNPIPATAPRLTEVEAYDGANELVTTGLVIESPRETLAT